MAESTEIEGVTEVFNRTAVEARSANEPEWLAARRAHAWTVYEGLPMPTTRLEEWRYTDLRRALDLEALHLGSVDPLPDDPSSYPALLRATMDEDHEAAGHLVIIDGAVVHTDIREDLASRGVVLMPLREAIHAHSDLVEQYLATEAVPPEESKFAALNAALWSDGIFLYVPRGVRLKNPIRVTRWVGEAGAAFFSRTLIVAESTSQVSYVDEVVSDDFDTQTFASSAVEVIAKDGAQVQYVALQRLGRGAFYQSEQRTLAGRDATLDTLNVSLGASVSRVDLNARLLGPGSNSDMLGLYFGADDQHFDHNTSQDHVAPHSHSDLLYKGALDDASRAAFRGIIRVHKGAQQTDAYQTNRNLLLSEDARADSLPNLEIEADDVKCSHGSTVGQLDDEQLFYLMSRGLPREKAERLVVLGFLGEVLSRLPLGGVVEKVTRAIEEKLRA
ncbi:MAG: Fe-S cluster assembly protein SufD [Gemmatimonadetes bacterium]|nr:Fe-S cluster assembly protein SufD [Gemmatimonadota bacterium]MBT8404170.1 Fe-S cluster assembly protein SufD [Gemmatimonadota bacterium]NNK62455.1 Fe-S cluster assembly protein SufD [Gemmatimonadota bacterium]